MKDSKEDTNLKNALLGIVTDVYSDIDPPIIEKIFNEGQRYEDTINKSRNLRYLIVGIIFIIVVAFASYFTGYNSAEKDQQMKRQYDRSPEEYVMSVETTLSVSPARYF